LPSRQAERRLLGVQPLPPRYAEEQLHKMQPLPARQAEIRLRCLQPLPARQCETELRGVQNGTRGSAEFEAGQARAGEFARDQARAVHHPRLLRVRRVKAKTETRVKQRRRQGCMQFDTIKFNKSRSLQHRHRVFQKYFPRDPRLA
jgi:hypothetical protein